MPVKSLCARMWKGNVILFDLAKWMERIKETQFEGRKGQ